MRASVPRLFRLSARRLNTPSTSSSASSSVSSAASSVSSAAQSVQTNPQVQRAVEQASKVYEQGAQAVRRVAGPVGDRLGSALGSYREPVVYNAKVVGSLARQVYQAERLAFPTSLSTWAHAYSEIYHRAVSPSFWGQALRTGAWAGLGVAALEAYGIFCVGEILGRRNLVGYKLKEH